MLYRQSGFTLIELMVSVGITGLLMAVSIPAYSTYRNQAALTVARVDLQTGLNDFSIKHDFSPATGMLADLVSEGSLRTIPNDPWTAQSKRITGTEEVGDWFYENDGKKLIFYALSHPEDIFELASLGLPPIQQGVMPLLKAKNLDLTSLGVSPIEQGVMPLLKAKKLDVTSLGVSPIEQGVMPLLKAKKLDVTSLGVLPIQQGVMPLLKAKKLDLTKVKGAGILALTPAELALLAPKQIAMMPAADFNKLTLEQKAVLTTASLAERQVANSIRALVYPRPWTMTAAEIQYLTATQLDTVPQAVFGSNLSLQQLHAISPETIKQMSGTALTGIARAKLSPKQIAVIPTNVSKNMRIWGYGVAQIKALSAAQLSTISQTIIQSNLNPQQIQAISPTTIQQMSGAALTGMAKVSFKLTAAQISLIPTSVSKNMSIWRFNTAQMQALSAAQLSTIPQRVIPSTSAQNLQAISVNVIKAVQGPARAGLKARPYKLTAAQRIALGV